MNCKHCQKEISKKNVFCSSSCSASFNNTLRKPRTLISKDRARSAAYKHLLSIGKEPRKKQAKIKKALESCRCGNPRTIKNRKYCSSACAKLYGAQSISLAKKGKPGPSRLRSGRGKNGAYDGEHFNSTWELAYWIYCKDHNISIKRCKEKFPYFNPETQTNHNYYPDFRVEGRLVEIKGYHTKVVDYKANSIHEPLKIYYAKDLVEIFDYIEKKYQKPIQRLWFLYD